MSPDSSQRTPALLLIGAIGTGKSDTSYHVFSRLYRAGIPTARLDLDDLGMCHPTPEDDPHNFVVKSQAMGAAWRVFKTNGAHCLVVSGALDTSELINLLTRQLPDAHWTVVRLRIGIEERRRRVLTRGLRLGNTEHDIEPWIEESDEDERNLDSRQLPGIVLQTDGLTPEEVADLVLSRTAWPSAEGASKRGSSPAADSADN